MEPCLKPETTETKSGDKPQPNPVMVKEGKGWRNFVCPHYDECLNLAAKSMWPGFTCKFCEFNVKSDQEI